MSEEQLVTYELEGDIALVCLNRPEKRNAMNPQLHYLRAMILQEQGALLDAAKELHRAIYLDHNFVLAHFALGNLERHAGHAKDAHKHFQNALQLLQRCRADEVLPESEGMTAGRLGEIIHTMLEEAPVG